MENQMGEKQPRRKPVKGVVKTARQMLADGVEEKEVKHHVVGMYMASGRNEKDAKECAAVIMHDVKHRVLKS